MCDFETNVSRRCATTDDLRDGLRLGAAAIALNVGDSSTIGLDDSAETVARCGGPEAIFFRDPFPNGTAVCLNCAVIGPSPSPHPDAHAVCVAQCVDTRVMEGSAIADARLFCENHARVSTNPPMDVCFTGACTAGGALRGDFEDPRRNPEPVEWTDLVGVSATATTGSLTRIDPTTGTGDIDINAGAVSHQWIWGGDAYVEFSASENTLNHIIGFSVVPDGCTSPEACLEGRRRLADVGFALGLNFDQNVYVIEDGGSRIVGPLMGYVAGDRFRITLTNRFDSPRKITYSRIPADCTPGRHCLEMPFREQTVGPSSYPVRVAALFRDFGATFRDVHIVFIHKTEETTR
jgi:hypothetical protein